MYQERITVTVKHQHREPTADGKGWQLVNDPPTQERVLLEIDIAAIAKKYGPQAHYNKSRKTRYLGGLVVITAQ